MIWTLSNVLSWVLQNIPLFHATIRRLAPPKIPAAISLFLPARYLLRKRETFTRIDWASGTNSWYFPSDVYCGQKERENVFKTQEVQIFFIFSLGPSSLKNILYSSSNPPSGLSHSFFSSKRYQLNHSSTYKPIHHVDMGLPLPSLLLWVLISLLTSLTCSPCPLWVVDRSPLQQKYFSNSEFPRCYKKKDNNMSDKKLERCNLIYQTENWKDAV